MKILSEKRMELSPAVASLSCSGMEQECRCCDFWQSIEDEDPLFLFEEGDILEDLMIHIQSEFFRVLRLAINLFKEPYERILITVSHLAVMEEER